MNEVKRFVRYTLPGLAALLQAFLILATSEKSYMLSYVKGLSGWETIGGAAILWLFSAGLGYLLSIIYFSLAQMIPWLFFYNHKPFFEVMKKQKVGRLVCGCGSNIDLTTLTRRAAWVSLNHVWYSLKTTDNPIGSIHSYIGRLCDVMHGLGVTFIGTLLTIVGGFWFVGSSGTMLLVLAGLAFFTGFNFISLRVYIERLCNTTLYNFIVNKEDGALLKDKIFYIE